MKMDDRMRVSDADREAVTARLREHFAEGRLTSEELDERITAALSAKTFGDLRHIMTDLPDPAPVEPQADQTPPPWATRPVYAYRRGPRLLPLALFILFAAIVLPGAGFAFVTLFKIILLIWLVTCLAGVFAAVRFRRNVRRHWQSGHASQRREWDWRR
jgi:hypothetical protein